MANNNWNNYTEKTATPVDADEVMVRDSTDGKNKKLLFGTFWKWVAKKLNEATISELQTSNKTIVGALNQLNSKTFKGDISLISYNNNDESYITAVFSVNPNPSCNPCVINIANRVCVFFLNGYVPKLLGFSMTSNVIECFFSGTGVTNITLTIKFGKDNYLSKEQCETATIITYMK